MYFLFALMVISFWLSIGLTEGWKWRTKPDNNILITGESYHTWRLITNISWLFGLLFAFKMTFDMYSILIFTFSFITGWVLYERFSAYAQYDDINNKKPDFIIVGKSLKRPPVVLEKVLGIVSTIILVVLLIIG